MVDRRDSKSRNRLKILLGVCFAYSFLIGSIGQLLFFPSFAWTTLAFPLTGSFSNLNNMGHLWFIASVNAAHDRPGLIPYNSANIRILAKCDISGFSRDPFKYSAKFRQILARTLVA